MNVLTAFIFVLTITILVLPVFTAFTSRRHPILGLLTVALTLLAALGSWYAFMESQSMPWTIGYALFALLGGIASYRHFTASSRSPSPKSPRG